MTDIRWLTCSDVHFPRHDPRLVSLWLDVLRYLRPHAIDLLGDIDDADGTSRWAEGTSREGFSLADTGVQESRAFLAEINGISPRSDKHFHDGNHGWFRHKKWLDKNRPVELAEGLYSPEILYEAKKSRFSWHEYDKPPVHRFGDIYAHHGESISKHAGESVRNDCLNFGVSLIRGHSHRLGRWEQTFPIDGRSIRGFEGGHLCNPAAMDYDISPNWQAGFLVGLVHENVVTGKQEVFLSPVEIRDYTCVVGTKVFEG